jgi:riboflavin transporter FmnP
MRAETLVRSQEHHVKPLVIRGGLARTFGSLVSFLAVLFLVLGLYLLRDAFAHPVEAAPAAILAAAFSITLAAILFYYLLKPRHAKHTRIERFRRAG